MIDDKRLDRIEAKIDDLSEHLSSIDTTLAGQHISLKDHIRRTALLEDSIKPIQRRVSMVDGALRLIGLSAAVVAIAEGISLIIGKK